MTRASVELNEQDVDPDPLRQFAVWFGEAERAGVQEPEAAAVASAGSDGSPSVRMVLVKRADERGFVFFTNYESRKGRELSANPRAALLFYWPALARQVRIEGPVQRTDHEESLAYARSRARASQLGALASPQSAVIASRAVLEDRVAELAAAHEGTEVPLPEQWGGFRLDPDAFEFWQQRDDRLHDRLRYTRGQDRRWSLQRLAP